MRNYVDIADVNAVAAFLAHNEEPDLSKAAPVDCIVLCVSAIFHCAEVVFNALQARPDLAKTLVLCGGIGHSTQYLYDAVAQNESYSSIWSKIQGLPEAEIMHQILLQFFDVEKITGGGCKVLVENKSTNCGANASMTRKVLERNGMPSPRSIVIVQDPTMSLRTLKSFEKVYNDLEQPPELFACPTFTPIVGLNGKGEVCYDVPSVNVKDLWGITRFYDLILGEIPRLRDDENGYGPRGKGFIVHADIPDDVEKSWARLTATVPSRR